MDVSAACPACGERASGTTHLVDEALRNEIKRARSLDIEEGYYHAACCPVCPLGMKAAR